MTKDWLRSHYEQGLVSVIVPCHNQERFLTTCLESVVVQDYRPIEVLMVNDGSSDGTSQIMRDFRNTHIDGLEARCLHQSHLGAQYARNQACEQSLGEFIQFLDGDDVICQGKILGQVTAFGADSEVDVVYGDGQYLIDFGGPTKKGRVISIGPSADITESLLYGAWVPNFSYLVRRSALQRCGPWDTAIRVSQDFEYFLRMAMTGCRFRYKPGIAGLYRKHSFSSISEQSASIRGRTRQSILVQAENRLRSQGQLNDQRTRAMVENYRRIARQTYLADVDCFETSLSAVRRLCPSYQPAKWRAKYVSSIIGFRNYEKVAALISRLIYWNKKDWF